MLIIGARFVYQVVIPKALAPKELVKVYESDERVVLPAWDPMVSPIPTLNFNFLFDVILTGLSGCFSVSRLRWILGISFGLWLLVYALCCVYYY